MCTGFFSVESFPSPKDHFHVSGDPLLWSVKLTVRGAFPVTGDAEKLVTGVLNKGPETAMNPVFVRELVPPAPPAVNVTEYSPDSLYVCTGFLSVELVSSPKYHFHEAGDPVLLSVKLTVRGAFPVTGDAEKLATGVFEMPATAI